MNGADKILLRIGNTILCNYGMTSNLGLLDGRMGACMFLYEYSRHTGMKEYEEYADDMIDPILDSLHKGQSEENISKVAGIGIGVIYLITHGFLEDTDDNDALGEVDKLLLDSIGTANAQSEKLTAASLYFIYRFVNYRVNLNMAQCLALAENIVRLCEEYPEETKDRLLKAYIVSNARQIIRLLSEDTGSSCREEYVAYEGSLEMTAEENTQEAIWYSYLLGTGKGLMLEYLNGIRDLSRNCFYDPDRNIGLFCAAGMTLMNRRGEQNGYC